MVVLSSCTLTCVLRLTRGLDGQVAVLTFCFHFAPSTAILAVRSQEWRSCTWSIQDLLGLPLPRAPSTIIVWHFRIHCKLRRVYPNQRMAQGGLYQACSRGLCRCAPEWNQMKMSWGFRQWVTQVNFYICKIALAWLVRSVHFSTCSLLAF